VLYAMPGTSVHPFLRVRISFLCANALEVFARSRVVWSQRLASSRVSLSPSSFLDLLPYLSPLEVGGQAVFRCRGPSTRFDTYCGSSWPCSLGMASARARLSQCVQFSCPGSAYLSSACAGRATGMG
jgi:hypothetical protein